MAVTDWISNRKLIIAPGPPEETTFKRRYEACDTASARPVIYTELDKGMQCVLTIFVYLTLNLILK